MIASASVVPTLVPTQQADAAQYVPLEHGVVALAAETQRGGERAVRLVVVLQQCEQITLPLIRLRQALGGATWREQRDQLANEFLLSPAQSERFAHALLHQQHIRE